MRSFKLTTAALIATGLLFTGCAATGNTSSQITSTQTSSVVSTAQDTSTGRTTATAGLNDSTGGVDWSSLPSTNVTLNNEGLVITEAGTYVLTGTSTGQVVVNSAGNVRIVLAGVTINSGVGAAIQVDNAELTVIELADGTSNTISDASIRSDEEIDGTIYSSDDLLITGSGTLNVNANFADGIVGKDELWIESGTINVTSVDDGIRGKDTLTISGGTITIDAAGDGLKSTNATDLGLGKLTITGGNITISSGDDAIKAEQKIWITGGTINVKKSVEGIEAPVIVIDGGDSTINASDDGINASTSDIITTGLSITINDGNLTIIMGAGDTDAIDSNGNLTINGGTINITAQSPFDFDGTGSLNGGTVTVNGQKITQLTNQMMGGQMGGGAMGGAPR